MATSIIQLSDQWSLIQSGSSDVSIESGSGKAVYTVQNSMPSNEKMAGHTLNPGEGRTIRLTTGENLYARLSSSANRTNLIRTV